MRFALSWGQEKNDLDYIYSRYFGAAPRYRKNLDKLNHSRIYNALFKLRDYEICTPVWRERLYLYFEDLSTKLLYLLEYVDSE